VSTKDDLTFASKNNSRGVILFQVNRVDSQHMLTELRRESLFVCFFLHLIKFRAWSRMRLASNLPHAWSQVLLASFEYYMIVRTYMILDHSKL
jgi:hypothetical protein